MKTRVVIICILLFVVLLAACSPTTAQPISLFYYNSELDVDAAGNILCTSAGLVAVQREVAGSLSGLELIEEAISLLITGELTAEERTQGLTTEFPLNGVTLESASLSNGELTITFTDPNFQTSGGACRSSVLRVQVEETALQFPGVTRIRFLPEHIFQP